MLQLIMSCKETIKKITCIDESYNGFVTSFGEPSWDTVAENMSIELRRLYPSGYVDLVCVYNQGVTEDICTI